MLAEVPVVAGRTIAIGDIHGCSTALAALLDAIAPDRDDTVVALGDYIDRGPDSRGVIEQLLALAQRCRLVSLKGNHEEMLLESLHNQQTFRSWLGCGGVEMLASYGFTLATAPPWRRWDEAIPREHWAFLSRCVNYYETETHIFVHAGYDPNLPMDQQPTDTLRWQFTDNRTAGPHRSGKIAVVGHTPQRSGEVLDWLFLKCIDTGCHAGGWLTALEVHTGQAWQTNQRGERRGRQVDASAAQR
jgi:serine/threonine protein phosphatase 1